MHRGPCPAPNPPPSREAPSTSEAPAVVCPRAPSRHQMARGCQRVHRSAGASPRLGAQPDWRPVRRRRPDPDRMHPSACTRRATAMQRGGLIRSVPRVPVVRRRRLSTGSRRCDVTRPRPDVYNQLLDQPPPFLAGGSPPPLPASRATRPPSGPPPRRAPPHRAGRRVLPSPPAGSAPRCGSSPARRAPPRPGRAPLRR